MMQVKNISYKVSDKLILDGVSANFEAGKLNLIIGPNGAGKTSLIKIICNHIKATSGQIIYDGKNVNDISIAQLAKTRAVLSQNIHLAFPLKVKEVVMMGRYPHFEGKPAKSDESACYEAMCFLDLDKLAERNYLTLSGGEMQRVQFARVMSQIWYPIETENRYLILDEPLTFLDVYYQHQFMNKITDLIKKNDLTVIGVLHDLNLAAKFADTILLLHQGKVVAQGNQTEVLTNENIKAVYNLEPVILQQNNSTYILFE